MHKETFLPLSILFLLIFWGVSEGVAQDYRISNDIVVKDINGQDIDHPWYGGFDNPHPHNMDLNGDGRQDLVITDFSGDQKNITFYPFVHVQGTDFRYAPEFEKFFDNCDCFEWAILKDYNLDSIPDIICGRNPGSNFKAYTAIEHCQDSFSFELKADPLEYLRLRPAPPIAVPIFQNRTDIPGIADVDFDGDIDIVTSTSSSNRLTFYRNWDVERKNPPGTLDFELESSCWGHFSEDPSSEILTLADSTSFGCDIIYPWRVASPRHVGTTLMLFDHNGDSLMDVILGDVDYPRITLVKNQGRTIEAFMTEAEYNYPITDSSAYMQQFLKTSFIDVNGDNVKDLTISPHNPLTDIIENKSTILWYENQGSNKVVDFKFRDRTLITNKGIDLGYESLPEFLDYNNDGLLDLCVGARSASDLDGEVIRNSTPFHLYENVGTNSEPEYRFISENYINFNVGPPFINSPEPAAGDLDNDGDTDLLIGGSDGRIYHYVNMAASGPTANFQLSADVLLRDQSNVPITVINNASPELHDLDDDGDLDLFIGNGTGRLYYYENVGTPRDFAFEFVTTRFGDIAVENSNGDTSGVGSIRPVFGDFDKDGNDDLIVGGEAGYVEIFTNAHQALQGTLGVADTLLNRRFVARISPAVANLDSSGNLLFVLGNEEGGLILVEKDTFAFDFCQIMPIDTTVLDTTDTTDTTNLGTSIFLSAADFVRIYPNPAKDMISISFDQNSPADTPKSAAIYNGLGQSVKSVAFTGNEYRWDIPGLKSGLYFLEIKAGDKRSIHKLLIRR